MTIESIALALIAKSLEDELHFFWFLNVSEAFVADELAIMRFHFVSPRTATVAIA